MYEKETDFCGCRRIDGCRGCDCLYGKLPSDLLNASIGALTQDESLNPVAVGCDCRNGCRYFK